jgi:outer membrane protein assembly factor BamD
MKRALLCFLVLAQAASCLQAALVWRPGEGWVYEKSGTTTALAASDAKEQLQLARNLESEENWEDAYQAYKQVTRKWPLSTVAGEAQFKMGLMLEKTGDFWEAYRAYQDVVKKYPGSQYFDLAIERQFSIGNLFLSGEPRRLWKIPLLPSMDKTCEIYDTVIKNAPYGKYAAPAYFNTGRARENQKKWSEAIAAYQMIIDKYPNDALADDAQYQIGYAWYRASSQPDYDQSAAKKSIEGFQDYLTKYPTSDKIDQARDYMTQLMTRQTAGAYNIARFYEGQKNYKAAFIYYNEVVQIDPSSDQAKEAKAKIDALRPLVEGDGKPVRKEGENPSLPTAPGSKQS